jgi:hypothetical protein
MQSCGFHFSSSVRSKGEAAIENETTRGRRGKRGSKNGKRIKRTERRGRRRRRKKSGRWRGTNTAKGDGKRRKNGDTRITPSTATDTCTIASTVQRSSALSAFPIDTDINQQQNRNRHTEGTREGRERAHITDRLQRQAHAFIR